MPTVNLRTHADVNPFNYFAIAILEYQGNKAPSEDEIYSIERQLEQQYPNREILCDTLQSLNLQEFSQSLLQSYKA
jgi:hypothetical protein